MQQQPFVSAASTPFTSSHSPFACFFDHSLHPRWIDPPTPLLL